MDIIVPDHDDLSTSSAARVKFRVGQIMPWAAGENNVWVVLGRDHKYDKATVEFFYLTKLGTIK